MKRKIWGLAAIVLALSLSAYTNKPADKKMASYYWFRLDASSGTPEPSSVLIFQSFDPNLCAFFAFGPYCEGAFTSYTGTGPYYAAGMEVLIHFELFP